MAPRQITPAFKNGLPVWPGTFCYAASLLRSPGPYSPPVFRSAICDCLSLNVSILSLSCLPRASL
jgi:hypothetical protein